MDNLELFAHDIEVTEHNLQFSYTFKSDDGDTTQTFLTPIKNGSMNIMDLDKNVSQILAKEAEIESKKNRFRKDFLS